jgi:hypothetical protein
MTSNFILNNFLTYRDQRLKVLRPARPPAVLPRVQVGLFANVGVAFSVYDQEPIWWLAGAAGRADGRAELRDVRTVRLAQAMNLPGLCRQRARPRCGSSATRLLRYWGWWRCGWSPPPDAADLRRSYYWMWSKHLAGGYYDHPPGVAVVIGSHLIAGDTELGVRLVSILLALPMSWAVYRTPRSCSAVCGWRRPRRSC